MAKFTDPLGQPFKFPESLVKQISECSPTGFLLFYIDQNGSPNFKADFIDDISELGLRSYVTNFINSINQAEDIQSTQNLLSEDCPPPDFDEED